MSKNGDPYGYVAKYVAKQGGELHFFGTLQHVNFSDFRKSLRRRGRIDTVHSANLGWQFFHMNNPRRKK
jgi:hypothetical protein